MGYSLENDDSNRATYDHVKRVAVIGAGVAGLQLAERLGKRRRAARPNLVDGEPERLERRARVLSAPQRRRTARRSEASFSICLSIL